MENRVKIWTAKEIEYVHENVGKITISDMADALGRSANAVSLYMLRHDIARHQTVKRNLMREMIAVKMPIEYFKPTKRFYAETKINQCQFQQIWHGYRQATNDEMRAVAKHLQMSVDDLFKFFDSRQLELFE